MEFPEKRKRILKLTIQECLGEAIKLFLFRSNKFLFKSWEKTGETEIRINLRKMDKKE